MLDKECRGRTTNHSGRAIRVQWRRMRRGRQRTQRARRKDRRGAGDDRLDDAADAQAHNWGRGSGGQAWARRRRTVSSGRVDHNDGIGGDFRVIAFNPILKGLIGILWGRLVHNNSLGELRQMRLRMLQRDLKEGFRRRTIDGNEKLRRWTWRSREGAQARDVVWIGVQMTSYIEG